MPRKIKKKAVKKEVNSGKIILITAGIILGVIAVLLIVLAIVQNVGKGGKEESEASFTNTSNTASTQSSADVSVTSEQSNEVSTPDFLKDVEIDPAKTYYADIDIKDYGKITVKLDPSAAPITVKNFVYLTNSGFYNGLTFHRIMEGFMMQGGDPQGNGYGGSPNTIYGEFSENGFNNPISHQRGVISMARSTSMDSASSQFFICQTGDHTAALDGKYAAFGQVTEGMDIVDKICTDAKPTDNNGTIPADQQPVINSITIRTEANS
ncbi:MAG: peptidylprolyl isomerase [Clostridia bacterium]|nr:peptidylprolyl isomerase [Clostridia bacterium]